MVPLRGADVKIGCPLAGTSSKRVCVGHVVLGHKPPEAVGIFETDKGKQGFLLYENTRKGIKLKVVYGRNGWEEVHEELRRNNGKLNF